MNRLLLAGFALVLLAPAAAAQDMPLSQILIDGEGWKPAHGSATRPASAALVTRSPDGSTEFTWTPKCGSFIEARQRGAADSIPAAPYCPLRVTRGTQPSVTALTTDKDGRIYAATPLGIQVFDPTGRMCGVIAAPPGRIDALAFEGNQLTAWVGDTKYARKLKTTGVP